ncbi:MAG TPA: hypothetical protein VJN42_02455, partial [Candidatus Acidoferrum sp.]|nr:hypothetical protein [Candidatus Acidoferrum sp.]
MSELKISPKQKAENRFCERATGFSHAVKRGSNASFRTQLDVGIGFALGEVFLLNDVPPTGAFWKN